MSRKSEYMLDISYLEVKGVKFVAACSKRIDGILQLFIVKIVFSVSPTTFSDRIHLMFNSENIFLQVKINLIYSVIRCL